MKKIGGKAGIYIIAVWLEFILSLSVLFYGQIERGCLGNDRSILAKLVISPIYIAMITAGADLRAAMLGIPSTHKQPPRRVSVKG